MLTFQWGSILVVSSWSLLSACSKILHQFGHQGMGRHLGEDAGGTVIIYGAHEKKKKAIQGPFVQLCMMRNTKILHDGVLC